MYRTGNKILLAICAYNFFLFIGTKLFYVWRNRYALTMPLHISGADMLSRVRESRWKEMTHAERSTYLATTKDRGNKRLDFRFAH